MFDQDKEPHDTDTDENSEDYFDSEILDGMTTSRGELKLRSFNDRNRMRRSKSFSDDKHLQVKDSESFQFSTFGTSLVFTMFVLWTGFP